MKKKKKPFEDQIKENCSFKFERKRKNFMD